MHDAIVLGVDIGGTHVTAAAVNLAAAALVPGSWVRQEVDSQAPAGEILAAWAAVITAARALQPQGPARIGISLPGPFDYEQGVCLIRDQHKFQHLYGLNVRELLAARLGLPARDILLHNDAACFLKGEAFGGGAKGASRALGFTLGTGLGAARFCNGQAEDANLWCAPFKAGIAEDYLSTRGLVNRYRQLSGRPVKDVEALAALCRSDEAARQAFREFGRDLGAFLTPYLQAEQPGAVVVGGNIARAWDLFIPETENWICRQAPGVALRPALLGETAAMMGAASYWAPLGHLAPDGPLHLLPPVS